MCDAKICGIATGGAGTPGVGTPRYKSRAHDAQTDNTGTRDGVTRVTGTHGASQDVPSGAFPLFPGKTVQAGWFPARGRGNLLIKAPNWALGDPVAFAPPPRARGQIAVTIGTSTAPLSPPPPSPPPPFPAAPPAVEGTDGQTGASIVVPPLQRGRG